MIGNIELKLKVGRNRAMLSEAASWLIDVKCLVGALLGYLSYTYLNEVFLLDDIRGVVAVYLS